MSATADNRKIVDFVWGWIKTIGVAFLLALTVKTSIVEAYKVDSGSMEDTLIEGDFLFANKFLYGAQLPLVSGRLPAIRDPQPGDIVLFKFPGDSSTVYIKRCLAVGGQTVEIKNKALYVDGVIVAGPELVKFADRQSHSPLGLRPRDNFGPVTVPDGQFFMMGDNRDFSYDSRFWGFVPRRFLVGQAMIIHWSWAPDLQAPEWSWTDPLSLGSALLYNTAHFFDRVQWPRLGTILD
jgi:signal peptidase I